VTPDVSVDCRGRPCPVPVIELARAVAGAEPGAVVEVVSDDPAARHDVPAWARLRGREYLGEAPVDGATGYRVRA
jgi:TusA-related sulfurtransferase